MFGKRYLDWHLLLEERTPWNKKWNYDTCYSAAKECKTIGEFRKNSGAYQVALRNGWIDDYDWLLRKEMPKKYWLDYDNCKEEAMKYKTRTKFARNSRSAYSVARKNGWLDDYTWLRNETFDIKGNIDCVYVYEFEELNAAYIGRTLIRRQKDRDREHIFGMDSVSKFAKEQGVAVPPMKILETDLTLEEGAKKEGEWVEMYREDGWTILNKAKTGSIGGLGKGKWNYDTCREEALKYKTRGEFQKGSVGAYDVALKNGWLDDYDWFERKCIQGKWTYDTCYDEAKKYKTRTEFYKGGKGAYDVARKNGWLDDYDWFDEKQKPKGYWNYDTCYAAAKKCKTIKEFRDENNTAYDVARKNGWLDDYDWFDEKKKPNGYWNYERCKEESKKYKSRTEFHNENVSAYGVARKNGWLDDYDWLEKKYHADWNYDTCREEAMKYNSRGEFRKNVAAYRLARKNGWLDDFFPKD